MLTAAAAAGPGAAERSPGGAAPPTVVTEPRTGMPLVEVPAGTFNMGSPEDEPARGADETRHAVTLTRAFLLGRFEVTQAEWKAVMGTSPSRFADCGSRCPVERVNYPEIQQVLDRLNDGSRAFRYRLPTEAEWEYACRARTTTPFSTGANLTTDEANYNGTFPYAAFPKGAYRARPRSARFRRTGGASPICTGTSGSGRQTGTARIPRAGSSIRAVLGPAP
jgi:formylglycine-generating enzyme required for sulfatase activity